MATLVIELIIAILLLSGRTVGRAVQTDRNLKTFTLTMPTRHIEPPPPREQARKPSGAAAPPGLKSTATEILAPRTPLVPPPPIVIAPKAGTGSDVSAGASTVAGPGSGSGGQGNGSGSDGDGDDDGETPPRQVSGKIRNSDYPHDAALAGFEGTVVLSYAVETNGRASHCQVTRSSGSAEIDANTCRMIVERFRFEPSRDKYGRPVTSYIDDERHSWKIKGEPPAAQSN